MSKKGKAKQMNKIGNLIRAAQQKALKDARNKRMLAPSTSVGLIVAPTPGVIQALRAIGKL